MTQNFPELGFESHVEASIGLVEDDIGAPIEVGGLHLKEIDEAA